MVPSMYLGSNIQDVYMPTQRYRRDYRPRSRNRGNTTNRGELSAYETRIQTPHSSMHCSFGRMSVCVIYLSLRAGVAEPHAFCGTTSVIERSCHPRPRPQRGQHSFNTISECQIRTSPIIQPHEILCSPFRLSGAAGRERSPSV